MDWVARKDDPQLFSITYASFAATLIAFLVLASVKMWMIR